MNDLCTPFKLISNLKKCDSTELLIVVSLAAIAHSVRCHSVILQ